MPPKRRTSGQNVTRSASGTQQSTLSFHTKHQKPGTANRITKSTSSAAKNQTKKNPALYESIIRTNLPAVSSPDLSEPTTAELAIAEQAEEVAPVADEPTEEEVRAKKVSEKQIQTYWRKKEEARKAPRVHQGDLHVWEKVLREFDMSGQYGPCIGIARLKRWKRANGLGLNPPIEVLAVLMKEEEKKNTKAERAYVDELMSSRFIET